MRYLSWFLVVLGVILFGSGCAVMQELFGTDGGGGVVGGAAGAAAAVGVPWAGAVKIGAGLISTITGFFVGKRGKINGASTVKLLDELKDKIKDLNSDEDVERAILDFAKTNPKYGTLLSKLHKKVKGKA